MIGEVKPVEVTKLLGRDYFTRIKHIFFEQIKQNLERRHFVGSSRLDCSDWWKCYFTRYCRTCAKYLALVLNFTFQISWNLTPAFAHVISLSEFAAQLTEVHLLAQRSEG